MLKQTNSSQTMALLTKIGLKNRSMRKMRFLENKKHTRSILSWKNGVKCDVTVQALKILQSSIFLLIIYCIGSNFIWNILINWRNLYFRHSALVFEALNYPIFLEPTQILFCIALKFSIVLLNKNYKSKSYELYTKQLELMLMSAFPIILGAT